jgi:hypothetical protein
MGPTMHAPRPLIDELPLEQVIPVCLKMIEHLPKLVNAPRLKKLKVSMASRKVRSVSGVTGGIVFPVPAKA